MVVQLNLPAKRTYDSDPQARILALERQLARRLDEQGPSPAEVVRERRRLRLAAEGLPFEEAPPRDYVDSNGRPLTIGEIIRAGRFAKLQRQSSSEISAAARSNPVDGQSSGDFSR